MASSRLRALHKEEESLHQRLSGSGVSDDDRAAAEARLLELQEERGQLEETQQSHSVGMAEAQQQAVRAHETAATKQQGRAAQVEEEHRAAQDQLKTMQAEEAAMQQQIEAGGAEAEEAEETLRRVTAKKEALSRKVEAVAAVQRKVTESHEAVKASVAAPARQAAPASAAPPVAPPAVDAAELDRLQALGDAPAPTLHPDAATSDPREKEALQRRLDETAAIEYALHEAQAREAETGTTDGGKVQALEERLRAAESEHKAVEERLQRQGGDQDGDLGRADELIAQLGSDNKALGQQVGALRSSLAASEEEKAQLQQKLTETLKAARNVQERKDAEAASGPSQAEVDAANKKMLKYKDLLKVSEQDVLLAQERLLRAMQENRVMQDEVADAQAAVEEYAAETEAMRHEVAQMEKERDGAVRRLAEVERKLQMAQLEAAKVGPLTEERDALLARVAELESLIEEKDKLIGQLRQDAAELGRKLGEALAAIAEAERLRMESEAALAKMKAAEAARTPDSVLAAEEALRLATALATTTAELEAKRKAQVASLMAELRAMEAARDEALAAAEAARKELAEALAAADAAKFADGQKESRIAELEARVAELEALLAEAQAALDMAHKRLRTLEEELSEAKAAAQAAAEAAAVAAVVSPRQEDGDGSRASAAAVSALEAENAALKKRIAELLEEIERLSESVRSLEGRLSDAASQPGDAGGLDNDDALRAMRANLAELMAALAEAQAEAARLARLNAELEAALAARAGGDEAEDERLRAELTKLQTQFRESPYNTGRHIATPATPAAPTAAGEPANTSVGGPADAGDATAEGAAVETAGAVTQTEAEPEVNVSIVETPQVHEAHEPQQPTPEPEPEPETQLQPATPHTVDPGQSSMRPLTGVSMVSSDSRPVTAVANEVAELREAIAREAAMAEELLSVKSELQRLRDDSDFERVEWEREKRGELLDAKGETRERGCQTDTEEEAALQEKKELSEREVSRVTHNERVRHKPRFIVPLPEEPLAQEPRDAKPLRWLLRIVRAMYDDKYLSDAVSIRPSVRSRPNAL